MSGCYNESLDFLNEEKELVQEEKTLKPNTANMICTCMCGNCKSLVDIGDTYCRSCGYKFTSIRSIRGANDELKHINE